MANAIKKLTATTPRGIFTRKTHRTYTHVVVFLVDGEVVDLALEYTPGDRLVEAEIGALHGQEAGDHQVGTDQQAETQRHLRDRERCLQPLPAATERLTATGFLQIGHQVRSCCSNRR